MNWYNTQSSIVPEDIILNTKIDDKDGVRNEQQLIKIGNLWWTSDKGMYVYYKPTHWSY